MVRRRTWCLALLSAAGVTAVLVVRRRGHPETPLEPRSAPAVTPVPVPTQKPTWLPPDGGACPDGYPVKVNIRSGIAYEPGGRFYDRTVPDRCYATAADAEADGYRRAKA